MAKPALPHLIDVIVCDDVRIEQSGKFVIVGMYAGPILMRKYPAILPKLAFFTKWKVDHKHRVKGDFRVDSPSRKVIGSGRIDMSDAPEPVIPEGRKFAAGIIEVRPFRVDELGWYRLMYRPSNGKWRKIHEFFVGRPKDPRNQKKRTSAPRGGGKGKKRS